jgi:hypothetical protein
MSADAAEATPTSTAEEQRAFVRAVDAARMKSIGGVHLAAVMAAITLWGAADAWAVASGLTLAWIVATVNAILAGYVITGILHEWGHFAGARLAGSVSPVLEKPVKHFFMFDFSFDRNDSRQFVWMSLGGIVTPWLLVLLTLASVPIDNASRAMLLAAFVTRAVQVSVFEVPVTWRAMEGGEPRAELGRQLTSGFATSRYAGLAVGAVVWLAA